MIDDLDGGSRTSASNAGGFGQSPAMVIAFAGADRAMPGTALLPRRVDGSSGRRVWRQAAGETRLEPDVIGAHADGNCVLPYGSPNR
jgi:hypothetical protein